MHIAVHPATTMLRGDDRYNPRDIRITELRDGSELLECVFRDDGGQDGNSRRPDRPFWTVIPRGFADWTLLNFKIFYWLNPGRRQAWY